MSGGGNPYVRSFSVFDDGSGVGPALYVGGEFTRAGGAQVNSIAKWDGSSFSDLAGGMDWLFDPEVIAMTAFDDGSGPALYAGGKFSSAGGVAADYIAKWDGSAWSPLGGGMSASGNDWPWVFALEVFDDGTGGGPALFAGGTFTGAGGVAANYIAKWDGSAWSPLGSGVSGGSPLSNSVSCMKVFDDGSGPALYVSGSFTSAGGSAANGIAKWDGTSWSPVGSGAGSSFVSAGRLTVFDDGSGPALYSAGGFSIAGGTTPTDVAKWDGTSWSSLAGGMSGFPWPYSGHHIGGLTVFDDGAGGGPALIAGGHFAASVAGDSHLAKYGCPSQPPTLTRPPWFEDFDDPSAYTLGQDPTNPSTKGWESWNLEALSGSKIRTTQARSGPHSLFIGGNADTVQRLTATSGKLKLVSHVYVPTEPGPDQLTRQEWWIALNTYNHNGPKNTSLQLVLFASGAVGFEGGPNHGQAFPGFPDRWAEIRAEIDLDANVCQVFYGLPGATIPIGAAFSWSEGVTGNGAAQVACVDLWANNQQFGSNPSGGVYFDDISFVREPFFSAFCTAKSTLVCGPANISATGTPSATAASGFVVEAQQVRGCRAGLLLYSNQPVQPGTSFGGPGNGLLCVASSGLRRAGPIESGGTSPQFCDGVMSIDVNRFHTLTWTATGCSPPPGQNNPAGFLGNMGTTVNAQMWGRDSIPTGQVLSDGIGWVVGP